MVSLKDIANKCGVSVATVSKALNDQPDVGVLFVDEGHRGLTHEFFAALLNSFKDEAELEGYDITFINNRNVGGKKTTYLQHCLYRGVDGLLIACVDFFDSQIQEVVNSSLPLVTIDHVFNNRAAVMSDNVGGVETLVSYAYEMGHRKIAFIYGEPTAVTENRKIYLVESKYYDSEDCYGVTAEMLALPDRPTCILFPDDFSLTGGVRAIRDAGLTIPDDISVMGYDGIITSQLMSPKITTLQQDTDRLGKEAAKKLIELIERPKTALLDRILVPGMLLPGESVRKLV